MVWVKRCTAPVVRGLLLFLLFLLVMLPVWADTQFDGAELLWQKQPIEYINPHHPQAAYLVFGFSSDEEVDSIEVDYAAINDQRGYPVVSLDPAIDCIMDNQQTFSCPIRNLIIDTSNDRPRFQFNFTLTNGTVRSFESVLELVLDATSPEVVFLGPLTCYDNTCYVGNQVSTRIRIDMVDETASFNKRKIAFTLGENKGLVYSCEDLTCYGSASTPCVDGRGVSLRISSYRGGDSTDDAGNSLTGILSTELVCDAVSPVVTEMVLTAESGLSTQHPENVNAHPFIAKDDVLIVTFTVEESVSPILNASIDAEVFGQGLVGGTCTPDPNTDGLWTCVVKVEATLEVPQNDVELTYTIRDLAGNEAKDSFVIDVFPPVEGPPDDWREVKDPARQRANKRYLEFTPKKLFLDLSLVKKQSSAVLMDVKPGECEPLEVNGQFQGSNGDLQGMNIVSFGGTTVLATVDLNMGHQYDDFEKVQYNCSVELLTLRGKAVNYEYEREDFIVTVDFHSSQTIGEMVAAEINETLEGAKEDAQAAVDARKSLQQFAIACKVLGLGKSAGGTMNLAGGLMMGTNYAPAVSAGKVVDGAGKGIQETAENIKPLVTACEIMSCKSKYNNLLTNQIGSIPGMDSFSNAMGYDSYAETVDPYNSWMEAAIRLCPPALTYHWERYQAIRCEYVACLSRDVQNGFTTIEDCQKVKEFGECAMIWGGVWSGVPFAGAIKKTAQTIMETASNPVSLFSTVGVVLACKLADTNQIAGAICRFEKGVTGAMKFLDTFNQIKEQFSGLFNQNLGKSACEKVRTNINRQSTYWNIDTTKSINFKGGYYVMVQNQKVEFKCNEFNGCTGEMKDKNNQQHTITVIPVPANDEDEGYLGASQTSIIFVDGKKSFDVGFYPDGKVAYTGWYAENDQATLAKLGLFKEDAVIPGDVTPAVNLISVGGDQYHKSIIAQAEQLSDGGNDYLAFQQAFNNYNRQMISFQSQFDALDTAATNARNTYTALDSFPDAVKTIGSTREEFGEIAGDLKKLYNENSNDESLKLSIVNIMGCNNNDCNDKDFTASNVQNQIDSNSVTQMLMKNNFIPAYSNYGKLRGALDDMEKTGREAKNAKDLYLKACKEGNLGCTEDDVSDDLFNKAAAENMVRAYDNKVDAATDDAEINMKNTKAALQREKDNLEEKRQRAEDALYHAEHWTGWVKTFRTTLRFARNMNALSSLADKYFGIELKFGLTDSLADLLDRIGVGYVANFDQEFCKSRLTSGSPSISVVQTASTTYKSAAHVEGVRIQQGFGTTKNYTYYVDAYVNNALEDDPLVFTAFLKGADGSLPVIGRTEVLKGAPFKRVKGDFVPIESEDEFDTVCLRFQNSNLARYFDVSSGDREFCRRLAFG